MNFKKIFVIWGVWRIGLFLLSAISILILSKFGNTFPYVNEMLKSSGLPSWFWQFGNFDGVHYIGIAKDGYIRQFTQAFFPVYPMMIKIVAPIFFNNFIFAGVFLSSVFTLLSVWMLSELIGNGQTPSRGGQARSVPTTNTKWIVLFFLFFPMSFFLGAIYNESFFLFLIFSCFYFAKRRNWLAVGVLGALASGTRLIGVFLLPAMTWEMIRKSENPKTRKFKNLNILFLLLIPVGLLIYMLFLQINFHDALYFLHAQGAFGASRSTGIVFPLVTIWRYGKILTTVPIMQYDFWVAIWEFSFFLIGLLLLILATIKKIRTSYLIFAWCSFILPLLTGTLSSFPRYLLVCFPIYIFLGGISNKVVKSSLLFLFLILNSIFSILFLRGYWVS